MKKKEAFVLDGDNKNFMRSCIEELCFRKKMEDFLPLEQLEIQALGSCHPPFAAAVVEAQKIFSFHAQRDNLLRCADQLAEACSDKTLAAQLVCKACVVTKLFAVVLPPPREKILETLYKKCGISECSA